MQAALAFTLGVFAAGWAGTMTSAFSTPPSMQWRMGSGQLAGKVCLVTGGARGIGKGIALGLGEQGATVYVTGRTESNVRETVEEVQKRGGKGVAVVCDHNKDEEIQRLFEQIRKDEGKLNVLVNNCFPAAGKLFETSSTKFWNKGLGWWDEVNTAGLRSHFIASQLAVPMMMPEAEAGDVALIVTVSSFGGAGKYIFDVAYGVGKSAKDRMASDMAAELADTNITSLALWPGAVKTEAVTEFTSRPGTSEEAKKVWSNSETPLFSGRAVASLAMDANRKKKSGKIIVSAEAAREYGFSEEDGSVPASFFSFQNLVPAPLKPIFPASLLVPRWLIAIGVNKLA